MAVPWHQHPAVVFNVLCCLNSNRDALHAASVCKAWADAAAAVPLPAKLHWSSDDTPEDKHALSWMSTNWKRVQKLALVLADGQDQQAAAQQLLTEAAQAATALHHLAIKTSGFDALPQAIWKLTNLHSLCLSHSWHPKLLPEQVAGLTALQQLALSGCNLQELPHSIGQLQQLKQLTINDCHYLECLPASICQLSGLQRLTLRLCPALAQLPANLGALASLAHLSISLCYSLRQLPASLASLPALQRLHLASNYELLELPAGLGGDLASSSSSSSSSRVQPSGLAASLTSLHTSGSHYLQQLPVSLGQLPRLRSLSIGNCHALSGLPASLSDLSSLSRLQLSHCPNLVRLPEGFAGDLIALQDLALRQCEGLAELPEGLAGMAQLSRLVLEGCSRLQRLPAGLPEVPGLQLVVRNCPGITVAEEAGSLRLGELCRAGQQQQGQQQQCGLGVAGMLQQLDSLRLVAG